MKKGFIPATLGATAAKSIANSAKEWGLLESIIGQRVAWAFVEKSAQMGFAGLVPGTDVEIELTKNEQGFSGVVRSPGKDSTTITNVTKNRAAATLCHHIDVAPFSPTESDAVVMANLGKTIDAILAKNLFLDQLIKAEQDPDTNTKMYAEDVDHPSLGSITMVYAFAQDNSLVAKASFLAKADEVKALSYSGDEALKPSTLKKAGTRRKMSLKPTAAKNAATPVKAVDATGDTVGSGDMTALEPKVSTEKVSYAVGKGALPKMKLRKAVPTMVTTPNKDGR